MSTQSATALGATTPDTRTPDTRTPDTRTPGTSTPPARRRAPRLPRAALHVVLLVACLGLAYPLVWMISASFKPTSEIFRDLALIPHTFTPQNYPDGWSALGQPTFTRFYLNSFAICALAVLGNLVSCTLCAYALARVRFPLRGFWLGVMLVGLMLPFHVTLVPQYILFNKLGWVGTILPLVVPKFLASDAFFVFLLAQFIRTLPRELDDAAKIDGCGIFRILVTVIVPLCKPALATVAIFTFLWTFNDFFSQLLYLGNSPDNFTVPVALGAFVDATSQSNYGPMLAMGVLSLIPMIGLFIAFQRLLVEGIATTGLRG